MSAAEEMLRHPDVQAACLEVAPTESALTSADFFNPFSSDFPRLANGLVDIEVYDDYLVDDPDTIAPVVRNADQIGWRHQHIYFWRSFYRQKATPKLLRDLTLLQFWRSPYNQLLMRMEQEARIHEKYKRLVSPPPIPTMEKSLVDFGFIDKLGAAAVGRRVALVPEAFEYVSAELNPHRLMQYRSPSELAGVFDLEIEAALAHLENPLVTPQRVVTGAISRIARLTNNQRLLEETERRKAQDSHFYPVRIRDPRTFLGLSGRLLDRHMLVEVKMDDARETLQTGVDAVELGH